jgi:hypothetical protein
MHGLVVSLETRRGGGPLDLTQLCKQLKFSHAYSGLNIVHTIYCHYSGSNYLLYTDICMYCIPFFGISHLLILSCISKCAGHPCVYSYSGQFVYRVMHIRSCL